ncbi:hypothetical protein OPT61_g3177 [Boeremia exigua]|uniref:Uncharacterized protein n=1 Tax=Boeremia exigua TaxID=749465 RepID=A0ACC2IIX8_9PLEO|nr:hypothetical protein OPT61_g3177 [Boeremia exigua]
MLRGGEDGTDFVAACVVLRYSSLTGAHSGTSVCGWDEISVIEFLLRYYTDIEGIGISGLDSSDGRQEILVAHRAPCLLSCTGDNSLNGFGCLQTALILFPDADILKSNAPACWPKRSPAEGEVEAADISRVLIGPCLRALFAPRCAPTTSPSSCPVVLECFAYFSTLHRCYCPSRSCRRPESALRILSARRCTAPATFKAQQPRKRRSRTRDNTCSTTHNGDESGIAEKTVLRVSPPPTSSRSSRDPRQGEEEGARALDIWTAGVYAQ